MLFPTLQENSMFKNAALSSHYVNNNAEKGNPTELWSFCLWLWCMYQCLFWRSATILSVAINVLFNLMTMFYAMWIWILHVSLSIDALNIPLFGFKNYKFGHSLQNTSWTILWLHFKTNILFENLTIFIYENQCCNESVYNVFSASKYYSVLLNQFI